MKLGLNWNSKDLPARPPIDWNAGGNSFSEICLDNIEHVKKAIKFCAANDYWHFRIPDRILPLVHGVSIGDLPDCDKIIAGLGEIKALTDETGVSLSVSRWLYLFHNHSDIVKGSIDELNFQSWILDKMGQERNLECPIILPVFYQPNEMEPEGVAGNMISNLELCCDGVEERAVFENDSEGFWTPQNLLKYFPGRAIAFNSYNYSLNNPDGDSPQSVIDKCRETWGELTPVFSFREENGEQPQFVLDNWDVIWEIN